MSRKKKLTLRQRQILADAESILRERIPKYEATIKGADEMRDIVRLAFAGKEREEMWVYTLTSTFDIIGSDCVSIGTVDCASVYPREIVKLALEHNAAKVILVHNHPSGSCEPSEADKRMTRKVVDALALVDIQVLDHLVVGNPDVFSFAEKGLV
jgi:DNA repair protein RadC